MKKYIDADALYKRLSVFYNPETGIKAFNAAITLAKELVKNADAADVAEVVHGEWLNFVGDYVTAECSVCGECYDSSDYNDKEHFDMFKQLYKFCPNCGAKMDGEKEGV